MAAFPRLLAVTAAFLLAGVAAPAHDLLPAPSRYTPGQGDLRIDENFRVALTGYTEPRLEAAAVRAIEQLSRRTGIPLAPSVSYAAGAALLVRCDHASQVVQQLGEDESYRLSITPRQAVVTAATPLGAMHGLATFVQQVELSAGGFVAPAADIVDTPRFPWRGLMLDVARHWMPAPVVLRTLDAMAALKLNVFHWHLSDDQGFRIESQLYPKLQGDGSDGHYYTQDQVRAIIAYARERGIRVVPEFDMPGHTGAWFPGYPQLAGAPGPYQIERSWGIFDPCMDPTRDEVYQFLDGFIGEMTALFPDAYFHIGGDEVNGRQWNQNPRIQEFKRAHGMHNNEELQAYFSRRVQAIVAKHGKKTIGWDEILQPDLPKDIVIQSWRGQKSLAQAATQGFSGILSSGYYLDLMQHASEHYEVDPLRGATANLTPEQQKRILGGEACMWVEYVVPENVDERIWPRMGAIAERLWSPEDVRDAPDMYRRLGLVSRQLDSLGLKLDSNYARMIRRLAGTGPTGPVWLLAGVVEPVKGYARGRARHYTQQTPLHRMVDAARPESEAARRFDTMVDRYLAGGPGAEEIRRRLLLWRANDARLEPVIERSALLRETRPLSRDLTEVSAAGLEALEALASNRTQTAGWLQEKRALLDRAAQPNSELLLSVVPPIRKLVEAAGKGR